MPKDGKLQTGLQESVCAVRACMLRDTVSWISWSSISARVRAGEDFTLSSPRAHLDHWGRANGRCEKHEAGLARKAPTDLENWK